MTELIDHVDLSQPLVSWHLRRLAVAGLVETRRSGREVICTLSRDALERFHEREQAMLGLDARDGPDCLTGRTAPRPTPRPPPGFAAQGRRARSPGGWPTPA